VGVAQLNSISGVYVVHILAETMTVNIACELINPVAVKFCTDSHESRLLLASSDLTKVLAAEQGNLGCGQQIYIPSRDCEKLGWHRQEGTYHTGVHTFSVVFFWVCIHTLYIRISL
jgi:hypothetical protein